MRADSGTQQRRSLTAAFVLGLASSLIGGACDCLPGIPATEARDTTCQHLNRWLCVHLKKLIWIHRTNVLVVARVTFSTSTAVSYVSAC